MRQMAIAITIRLKLHLDNLMGRIDRPRRDEGLSTLEWIIIVVGAATIATLVVVAYRAAVNERLTKLKDGG